MGIKYNTKDVLKKEVLILVWWDSAIKSVVHLLNLEITTLNFKNQFQFLLSWTCERDWVLNHFLGGLRQTARGSILAEVNEKATDKSCHATPGNSVHSIWRMQTTEFILCSDCGLVKVIYFVFETQKYQILSKKRDSIDINTVCLCGSFLWRHYLYCNKFSRK